MGLIEWHYYSLLGCYKVHDATVEGDNKTVYLVKLRNPWGKKIWEGGWNSEDEKWTRENKKSAGYKIEDFQTGSFYIEMSCFIQYFSEIDILRTYGKSSIYTQCPIKPVQFNSP
jgi:hypothetical protein